MFKKLLSVVMAFIAIVAVMAIMNSTVQAATNDLACKGDVCISISGEILRKADVSPDLASTECGENVCLVCDINGRCHLEPKLDKKKKGSSFKLAKYQWDCSGSGTKCKICTKNGSKCIYKDKKLVQRKTASSDALKRIFV